MPTNLSIDDDLLREAQRLGKHATKRQTVNEALREYVARLRRREILGLSGLLEWDKRYDYQAARRR
ncbi:MAG: type II toxin-antitoxin system VapB family antitoxin [Myxococcales bacterium]|nr:type II toxin-antitoxin system VapB family antitoxin [Myxococcales bacterium]